MQANLRLRQVVRLGAAIFLTLVVGTIAFHETPADQVFQVWDPNDPDGPGTLTFERAERRFWATTVYDTRPGPIRVFRMYYSRVL